MSKISTNQLASYALNEIAEGADTNVVSSRLAGFLLYERRTRDVPALLRSIEKELSARGIDNVTITSAYEISEGIKNQLASMLNAKSPVFVDVIDTNVIGGVKARSGENEIDLTIKDRLNRFKQQVLNKAN